MKNAKSIWARFGVASLALAMALGLVACNNKTADQPSTTEPTSTEEPTSGGDEELTPNYSGKTYDDSEFKILMRSDTLYVNEMAIDKLTTTSTELDKKVYYRNKEVERKMGVTLTFITDSQANVQSAVKNAFSGNMTDAYDLVINHGRSILHGAESGYYVDWNTMPTVNTDAPWWSQNIKSAWTTPSGKLYAANGDISYLSVGVANCMYFNKDLVAALEGAASPYTYVNENNWTFETFFQSARDVGGTIASRGGYGYVAQVWRGPVDALYASGYSTIVINEDRSYRIGIQNERSYNTIDAYVAFLKEDCAMLTDDLGKARRLFTDNNLVYFDDNIYAATSAYKDVNFGILPFPKYSTDVENYQSLVGSGADTFAIFALTTDENRQRIGDVVECLAYIGYTDVVPFYFDTLVTKQSTKDPESRQSLTIIRSTLVFDLGHYLNPGSIGDISVKVVSGESGYPSLSTGLEKMVLDGKIAAALAVWLEK